MLGSHGGPGGQRHRQLRGRVRRDRLDASGDLPNPATALVERTARPVRSLELVPLGGERAADLADERRRLGAGAGDDRLSPALRGGFRLARLRELGRGLGADALDLACPLGLRASVGVERCQEIGEPRRVLGAMRVGAGDQLRAEAEPSGDR